jgi:TrmH family RNA methyltransferase
MSKYISSLQNPIVKNCLLLKGKSKARKTQGLFVLEGVRELTLALKSGYQLERLLFYADLFSEADAMKLVHTHTIELIEISKAVYQKLAYRDTTEGIVSVVRSKDFSLKNLVLNKKHSLILVAEAPEKPGNIGALLRTADAANIDAVLIANPKTDLFNPNIIRSSVGCIFTNQIAIGNSSEIIEFLKNNHINMYAAALHKDSEIYTNQDFTKSTAIIVGTEATGLSDEWLDQSKKIIIPMQGAIDSLNVSVSAAVLVFEAVRQRS